MKFNCGNCGEIDCVIIDGYGYGDRLLEGVTFEVRRDDDGKYHAQVEEFSRDYFAQFNQQLYLSKIEQGMETEEFAICPQCGEEVMINKVTPRPSFQAKLSPLAEILGIATACTGTATISLPEDVGERTTMPLDKEEEEEEEEEESSSAEGGDSGGGGASEDLGEPEPENEDADSSSDDSDDSDDSSSDES